MSLFPDIDVADFIDVEASLCLNAYEQARLRRGETIQEIITAIITLVSQRPLENLVVDDVRPEARPEKFSKRK